MSTVPTPTDRDERINDNPDFRDGYVEGYLDALTVARVVKQETVEALGSIALRRRALTPVERKAILGVLEVLNGHLESGR
ncbi:hypothetical protein Aph02nite_50330 [Actinoplanes philippinensis]|uniref:Uncharacterized protein n=1 Tax=Actinoplanes philippinensis TaxID=35752 RepID=A0A1I2IRP8_9ACTN|nr:hypothetical protein [Actinoplanes philippinensis]GIE79083.1 hypothetical protein Aph02nite_50330 [Actinoplanes philippinensis]SFF44390.1 hypothetical protein SAMN05421541_110329 [Actinoplanes philippinensis]